MKLLLVSDKEESYIWDHFDMERFKDIDFILSCGDLSADYLSFLVTMVNKPLFYVPGNHDKTFVRTPPEGCGGRRPGAMRNSPSSSRTSSESRKRCAALPARLSSDNDPPCKGRPGRRRDRRLVLR